MQIGVSEAGRAAEGERDALGDNENQRKDSNRTTQHEAGTNSLWGD